MTRTVAVAVAVALVAGGAATSWWLASSHGDAAASHASVPVNTSAVVRRTLDTSTQLSGAVGYSGSYTLTPALTGTITALPSPGTVIARGGRVYEVDGVSVFLFLGSRPAWRSFMIGMTTGSDIRELEQNLTSLGFGHGLTVDDQFTWATERAVESWQRATGQTVTGTVERGRVAFVATSLRVVSDSASLGAPAQPGQPVLTASSPDPEVTVSVPATQTYLVHRGDRVSVTLPSGAASTGRVSSISLVAAPAADSGSNGPNGAPGATVAALVVLDHPAVAAGLDQAPVTVSVVDREVRDVLAVPITALVALAGGGYGVWVDSASARHLVAVTPGLFADTLVQVSATTLQVGDRVEVPAQ